MIRKINGIFVFAGTLIMAYVMAESGKSLKTPETAMGIINLEFASTKHKVNMVLNAWSYPGTSKLDNISVAIKNTWFDFIFLFFYSLMLFYACLSISNSFTGFLNRTGKLLATGSLYAGLFDIIENAGMLISLNGHPSNMVAIITATFSVMKWTLVICAIVFILVTGPAYIVNRLKRH